jgi:hypothetical protein
MSRDAREQMESDLKGVEVPALVATSSLELNRYRQYRPGGSVAITKGGFAWSSARGSGASHLLDK